MADTVNILNCLNEVKTIVPIIKKQFNTISGMELENTLGRPNFDTENNVMINEDSLKMKNRKGSLKYLNSSDSDYFSNSLKSKQGEFLKDEECKQKYKNNKTEFWKELIEECVKLNTKKDEKSSFLLCTHSNRIKKYLLNNFNDNNFNNCFCMSIKFQKKSGFYVPKSKIIFNGFKADENCYFSKNTCDYPNIDDVLPIKVIRNKNMKTEKVIEYKKGDSFNMRKYIFNSYDTTRNQYYNVLDFTNITKENYDTIKDETEKIVIDSIDSWDNTYQDYYVNINLSNGKPHRLLSREIIKVNNDLTDSPCSATDTTLFCGEEKNKVNNLKTNDINIDIDEEFTIRRSKKIFDNVNKEYFYLDILKQKEINIDEFTKINNNLSTKNLKVILKAVKGDMIEIIIPKFKQRLLLHYNLLNLVNEYDITTECFTKHNNLYSYETPGPSYSPYLIETEKDINTLSNMTIYLIRHGDSLHNNLLKLKLLEKEKKITKTLHRFRDSSLTPVGIAQAAHLGSILKSEVENTNTFIISSYLNRAQHTGLQIISNIFKDQFREKYPKLYSLLGLYNIMAINRIFYAYNKSSQKTYDIFKNYKHNEIVNTNNKELMRRFILNCLNFKQIDSSNKDSERFFFYINIKKGGNKKTKKLKTNRFR